MTKNNLKHRRDKKKKNPNEHRKEKREANQETDSTIENKLMVTGGEVDGDDALNG